jgi:hypothetical protein
MIIMVMLRIAFAKCHAVPFPPVPHSVHHLFPFSHPLSQEAAALWYERQILIIIIIRVHVI